MTIKVEQATNSNATKETIVGAQPGDILQRLDITHLTDSQLEEVSGLVEEYVGSSEETIRQDDHSVIGDVEARIAMISGASGYEIPIETQEAYRLFCGKLFETISNLERADDAISAQDLTLRAHKQLFSSSPNIASYSGAPEDQFRLLALAQATPLTRNLSQPMIGELAYSVSFGGQEDVFSRTLDQREPLEQLQSVRVLQSIAYWAIGNGDWAEPAANKALTALDKLSEDANSSHFVRLVAAASSESIRSDMGDYEWVDLDSLPTSDRERLVIERARLEQQEKSRQQAIRQNFPELARGNPQDTYLVQVANDCAFTWESGGLRQAEYHGPNGTVLANLDVVRGTKELDLSGTDSLLISEMQSPAVRDKIESELGVKLADIGLRSQIHLISYMVSGDIDKYERIKSSLAKTDGEDRLKLVEGFLAVQYGHELGDALLDVCESCPMGTTLELLSRVDSLRANALRMGSLFRGDTDEGVRLAEQVSDALMLRVSEVLAVIAQIGRSGAARAIMYNGQPVEVTSIDDVIVGITELDEALSVSMDSLAGGKPEWHEVHGETLSYWYRQGHVLVQVLGSGSRMFDPRYQFDGEARINFLYNPNSSIDATVSSTSRSEALSIRLDREGIILDNDGQVISNDPEVEQGTLSLDVGSIYGDPNNPNVHIGSILAIGNAIISARRGTRPHFTHIRETFDPELGRADLFASVAQDFTERIEANNAT